MEMTCHDIRNYLEKIYNVFPADIRTNISQGKVKRSQNKQSLIKEEDMKVAFVSFVSITKSK